MNKTELLNIIKKNHDAKRILIGIVENRLVKDAKTDVTKKKLAKFLSVVIPDMKNNDKIIYKELEKIIDDCLAVDISKKLKENIKRKEKLDPKDLDKLIEMLQLT